MLFLTLTLVLAQFLVAALAPTTFVVLALWTQTMPYTWNWDTQSVFLTPVGPLNVVAMQLFGFVIACALVVISRPDRASTQLRDYRWHVAFLLFCVISLAYASSAAYGLRMLAKLIGPPLFLIVVLSTIDSLEALQKMRKAILGSGVILLLMAILARALHLDSDPNATISGISGLGPPGMGPPVFGAHMLPVAMLALATYLERPRPGGLVLTLCCAAAVFATLQRTSSAALFIGFSTIFFFGTRGVWRFLLPTLAFLGFPVLLALSSTFRNRMFYGEAGAGELLADPMKALDSLNGSGRFDLWDVMLKRFYAPHPLFGSGIGSTQDYLYSQSGGAGVVHSEYVRLLCEVGLIGLVFFIATFVSYLLRLRRWTAPVVSPVVRTPALAALGSVVAYLLFLSTDNGFDYVSQFGIYVFALIAMAERASQFRGPDDDDLEKPLTPADLPFPNLMR